MGREADRAPGGKAEPQVAKAVAEWSESRGVKEAWPRGEAAGERAWWKAA